MRAARVTKKNTMIITLVVLAGILCLAVTGVYLYGHFTSPRDKEYDGIMVWVEEGEQI